MRSKGKSQAVASSPDQPLGGSDLAQQLPQQIGSQVVATAAAPEPFADVLHDCDLIRRLSISTASFYTRKARGEFRCFELESQAGRTEYSGALIAEWLRTGDRPRRFFRGARPAVLRTGKPGRPKKLRAV